VSYEVFSYVSVPQILTVFFSYIMFIQRKRPNIGHITDIMRLKCDGTCAETRFRLSPKRTSPFKSAGASVQSTTGSRGVRISGSNAGYTMFRGSSVRVLATHSISQFPLHYRSRASPCVIRLQTHSTSASPYVVFMHHV
jgi:hypothetical protein